MHCEGLCGRTYGFHPMPLRWLFARLVTSLGVPFLSLCGRKVCTRSTVWLRVCCASVSVVLCVCVCVCVCHSVCMYYMYKYIRFCICVVSYCTSPLDDNQSGYIYSRLSSTATCIFSSSHVYLIKMELSKLVKFVYERLFEPPHSLRA